MRMLMTVRIPVEAGNAAIVENKLPGIIQGAMERLKPEAAYFTTRDGERSVMFVFDMTDSSQMVPSAEPFFQQANAKIDMQPVMNVDDLQAGLSQM